MPPGSLGRFTVAARAPTSLTTSSPPNTFVSPFSPTSLVPSTIRPAAATASSSAPSASASPLGSVSWTS